MLKAKESLLEEALDMTCQINSQESYDSFISKLSAVEPSLAMVLPVMLMLLLLHVVVLRMRSTTREE